MKLLLIGAGLGVVIAVWFGYFWLEEQRRWAQPIPLLRQASRHINRTTDRYYYDAERCRG